MTAGRRVNTKSVHWCTPPKYVEPIRDFFAGEIELDPCSNDESVVGATVELYTGGLEYNWNIHQKVFVNPPYGRYGETTIYHWLEKCYNHNGEIIALIPVAPNTKHWKEFVFKSDVVCFLGDTRLKFLIDGSTDNKGASMACALIYWGHRKDEFIDKFSIYGNCCIPCGVK